MKRSADMVAGDCHLCQVKGAFVAEVAAKLWRCEACGAGGSTPDLIRETFGMVGRSKAIAERNVKAILLLATGRRRREVAAQVLRQVFDPGPDGAA